MKKEKEPKPLSWSARRKGKIYCSPACGAGCTYEQYKSTNQRAKNLKEFLDKNVGGVWKIRVWENLGWHSEVHQGTLAIYIHTHAIGGDSFMLMNSGNHSVGCGHSELTVHHPKTEKQLVKAVKKSLEEQSRKTISWVNSYRLNRHMDDFIIV